MWMFSSRDSRRSWKPRTDCSEASTWCRKGVPSDRYLCGRFLSWCGSEPRVVVQAHSMRKPQGVGTRSGRASAVSLRPVLWYAWTLIQPRRWLMAGFVDLDQRLCGCLIVGRGDSCCAGDVSRSEGFPLAAWANRAYGDDTGRLAGISDRPGRFWVPWRRHPF